MWIESVIERKPTTATTVEHMTIARPDACRAIPTTLLSQVVTGGALWPGSPVVFELSLKGVPVG